MTIYQYKLPLNRLLLYYFSTILGNNGSESELQTNDLKWFEETQYTVLNSITAVFGSRKKRPLWKRPLWNQGL